MFGGVYKEDQLVPLSALQHYIYCPRQCAFIHNEMEWAENMYTAEGSLLHARVDLGGYERRPGISIERSVMIRSFEIGVSGIADVVEIDHSGRLYPVEYKRGRVKNQRADEVQLCAQALCLEEMLNNEISEGALFYGKSRRRKKVIFDAGLRELTKKTAEELHNMLSKRITPPPVYSRQKCDVCSLKEICQPLNPRSKDFVDRMLNKAIEDK